MGAERVLQILIKAKDQATEVLEKASDRVAGSMSSVKAAMGAVGLMAAGYLKGAIESAAKAEEGSARLKTLVEDQGQAWDIAKDKVSAFTSGITKMSTYSGPQAREALIELTSKGVKLNDALGMQTTLANLAAGKNIELSEAAGILSDAYNGKTRALVGLGLATKEEIKNGISFEDVQKRINERFNGAAAGQLNTYAGQMQQFHNNLNALKATIGSYILPYFLTISKHLNDLAQKLNGMDPGTKKLIANVLGLTAVFGTLIGGAGLLQKVFSVLGPMVSGLGTVIGGLTLPIVAVIGVIALLTAAYVKNWGGMKTITDNFIGTTIKFFMNAFAEVQTWFVAHWPQIQATFAAVIQAMVNAYNTYLKPVLKFVIQEFSVVVDWVKQNWPLIQQIVTVVLTVIKVIIQTVLSSIVAFWTAHGQTVMAVVNKIWDIIKTAIDIAIHVVLDIIKFVMNLITGHWEDAWNNLVDAVKRIFGGLGTIISDILSGIGIIFADIAKTAIQWGENLINGFINGIKNAAHKVTEAVDGVIQSVKNFIGFNSPTKEGEGRYIVEWGANMIGGFMQGINSQLPNLQALMQKAIKAPTLHANVQIGGAGGGSLGQAPEGPGLVANSRGRSPVTNQYILHEGAVQISAKDLAEMKAIHDFFNRFPQVARAGGR